MIISCYRCKKEIDTPDASNADYIVAADLVVKEPREVLIALKHNATTLAKEAQMKELNPDGTLMYPDLAIADSEYDAIEVGDLVEAKTFGEDLVKVIAEVREKDIQKTGVICPDCYKPTDILIWGVHKG